MKLSHSLKYSGQFWVPGAEQNKAAGDVAITQSGAISLRLNGNLHDNPIDIGSVPRIVGSLENGEYITLDGCFYVSEKRNSLATSITELHVGKAVLDARFDEGSEIETSCFRFSVEGLDEWLDVRGITVNTDYSSGSVNIAFVRPDEIVFPIPDGLSLEIAFDYTPPSSPAIRSAVIRQKVMFKLHSVESRKLETFVSVATQIKDLLCLLMDAPISFDVATILVRKRVGSPGEDRVCNFYCNCYFEDVRYSESTTKIDRHRMLLSYADVANGFPEMVRQWLLAYRQAQMAFVLYFHTFYKSTAMIDEKFLSLAQGLESLHRSTSSETRFPRSEFRKLARWLSEVCPPSRIEWFNGLMSHGNQLTLAMRLERLLEPFKELFGVEEKRGAFLSAVKNARNELTHPGGTKSQIASDVGSLWSLQKKVHVLFQLNLLLVLGLSSEQICAIAKRNMAIQFALGR